MQNSPPPYSNIISVNSFNIYHKKYEIHHENQTTFPFSEPTHHVAQLLFLSINTIYIYDFKLTLFEIYFLDSIHIYIYIIWYLSMINLLILTI